MWIQIILRNQWIGLILLTKHEHNTLMNKKAICVKNQEMKRNPRNNFIQKRNESNKKWKWNENKNDNIFSVHAIPFGWVSWFL